MLVLAFRLSLLSRSCDAESFTLFHLKQLKLLIRLKAEGRRIVAVGTTAVRTQTAGESGYGRLAGTGQISLSWINFDW